ncbi:6809_t:CDS:2 [Funneliformis geosporum]|nr:6809_t:CDS:2 [Funneliformis geosporum]
MAGTLSRNIACKIFSRQDPFLMCDIIEVTLQMSNSKCDAGSLSPIGPIPTLILIDRYEGAIAHEDFGGNEGLIGPGAKPEPGIEVKIIAGKSYGVKSSIFTKSKQFKPEKGKMTKDTDLRFMLFAGKSLKEHVINYGPFDIELGRRNNSDYDKATKEKKWRSSISNGVTTIKYVVK